jgi:succinoglycan biosynthesis transport protein ExoP
MEKEKEIGYYLHLLKIKKWLLIIPAILITVITLLVAYLLPSVYESSSTILIEEQQIPQDLVRTTVTGVADERIQSLTQQILSRTRLWETIKQFNLYPHMREKSTNEEIIEQMRDDIKIETISVDTLQRAKGKSGGKGASQNNMTIAFTISYRGKNPGEVQKVAGNLASLYLEQNLKDRQEKAETTTKFLEAELKELDDRLALLGKKITKFKEAHEGTLPELQGHNLSQAERLENEIKQLENQIRAGEDKKSYFEGQLATINPDLPIAGQERTLDPKTQLYTLQVQLAAMLAKNSENHPDIIQIKKTIAGLEKLVSAQGGQASVRRQKISQLRSELATKEGRLSADHPEIKKLKSEIARLEKENSVPDGTINAPVLNPSNPAYIALTTQIQGTNNEITLYRKQQADLREKLRMYRQRLEETPKIEQEYMALQRDYANAHSKHMEVMNKLLEARIGEGMEESQKAEKFTLIDPASFPEKPVSPNRLLIMVGGVLLGLIAGIGSVLVSDQLDHSVKDADDIGWITDLPILGSISRMTTPDHERRLKRRKLIIAAATCFSILVILVLVHFLYRDLWVLMAQLMRLFNKYS